MSHIPSNTTSYFPRFTIGSIAIVIPAINFGRLSSKKDDTVSFEKRELVKELRNGLKEIPAVLAGYEDGKITAEAGKETITFEKSEVALVRLRVEF